MVQPYPAISHEHYRYGAQGSRSVKTAIQRTGAAQVSQHQVRYLSALEVRTCSTGDRQTKNLQVIMVNGARILYWQQGRPEKVQNKQIRFSVTDRTGSSQSELDREGKVISREQYYPFGGTALWATRNQTEAHYKVLRYSGKERDVTGLVYYGYRYYVPWLMRWLNADPAGTVDGVNLFRMCRNNPASLNDRDGLAPIDVSNLRGLKGYQEGARGKSIKYLSDLTSDERGNFGIPNTPPSLTKISTETLEYLRLAQNANLKTKELLPYGSTNMGIDVYRTGGKNISLRRMAILSSAANSIERIIMHGAGNCAEHSQITFNLLAWQGIKEPIFRVRAEGIDHNYVTIGDSRRRGSVIVADSWVTLPASHLEDEGKFKIGGIISQSSPSVMHDPKYAINDNIELIECNGLNLPIVENYIENNQPNLFNQFVSLNTAGARYSSDRSVYRFDGFPERELIQLAAEKKEISDLLKNIHNRQFTSAIPFSQGRFNRMCRSSNLTTIRE